MQTISLVLASLSGRLHRDEQGQGTVEYVLLILGVVLFLLVAAFALQGVLSNAIVSISSWIAGQNPP
ncbi:MAG TPA: hypothetical protein VJT33_01940 [bacterium]|nr:hypothetical protein [bacterium]